MMREDEKLSPAMQLLKLVWEKSGHGRRFSRTVFDHVMNEAWELAITSNLEFYPDDLLLPGRNDGRWRYVRPCFETAYTLACGDTYHGAAPNRSALAALEKYKGRKPYILKTEHCKTGRRLHVGSQFAWEGEKVRVTSFSDERGYLTACSHKSDEEKQAIYDELVLQAQSKAVLETLSGNHVGVKAVADRRYVAAVKRVFKITHADLRKHSQRVLSELPLPEEGE
jgi:hypothetical protein